MAQVPGMINSPMSSKINWTQFVALGVTVAAIFGIVIPPEIQDAAIKIVALGAPVLTFILRTWFTAK